MQFKKRTVTCGGLNASSVGRTATLTGWVDSRRDLGGLIFIYLRDRYGKTQVVFNPRVNPEVHRTASELRTEYVISVTGTVERRPAGQEQKMLATGEIDLIAQELTILNKADTTPFAIADDVQAQEELRLQYRYLDLRRAPLQRNLATRHRMAQITRSYFDGLSFLEIETPVLMKSTPEGARDYLVPSRVHPGKFYALPQSPQTYKQILMVAGMDRYFQIVKCFRDEDLRADRQPEFTQIDVEMSFIDETDIQTVAEGLVRKLFLDLKGIDIPVPLPRMTYREAMEAYGSDKPDTRFGLRFTAVTALVSGCGFRVFADTVKGGGVVAGFVAPGCAEYSRSQLDNLTATAKTFGAGGLVWMRVTGSGIESPVAKFLGEAICGKIAEAMSAVPGDLILLISDGWRKAYTILGALRLEVGRQLGLLDDGKVSLLWVTEFPMFEYDETERRYVAMHHPFTAPMPEDIPLLSGDPLKARARAYDLVLNGNEIAGGSIRIHDRSLQQTVFGLLGIREEEASRKFGFLLDAFRYGAPPHGGIAFGFDRTCMILSGEKSIRDVIAFPKTTSATSLMDNSPSDVDPKQLEELHIKFT